MTRLVRSLPWLGVVALGLVLALALLRLAWLSDDAYIMLRSVENLLRGHGPVWNADERVQTFTHPLWFWLVAGARWLGGECYYSTIVLSLGVSYAGAVLLARRAARPLAIAAVLALLLGSRAYCDFATSGLETPLAVLLLALLAMLDRPGDATQVTVGTAGPARPFAVALLTALIATTRLDLAALAGPLLLAHLRGSAPLRLALWVAAGLAPLFLWSAFATFYYGTPLPITAYAKALTAGLPAGDLMAQGWRYTVLTATHDPVTIAVILAGLAVGFGWRQVRGRMLAVGILVTCLYVVRVGGDFMIGRFFVPPFAAAVALLARALARTRWHCSAIALAMAALLTWLPGRPIWTHAPADEPGPDEAVFGVIDERRFYWRTLGLFSPGLEVPEFGRLTARLREQGRDRPLVMESTLAGVLPFLAGDLFHFVDLFLCDPLLARLPTVDTRLWRIGHFSRGVPDGYLESIAFGDDRIVDPDLRTFYTGLRSVVHDPLTSSHRLTELAAQLGGRDREHLARFVVGEYAAPPRRTVALADLQSPPANGTFWFDDAKVRLVARGGWTIDCGAETSGQTLVLVATPQVRYRFSFLAGEREIGHAELEAFAPLAEAPKGPDGDVLEWVRRLLGVQEFRLTLPAGMPPFDRILLDCTYVPCLRPAIGGLRFDG